MRLARCVLCLAVGFGVLSSLGPTAQADPDFILLVQAPKEQPKKKDFVGPPAPDNRVASAQPENAPSPDVSDLPRSRSPQFLGDLVGGSYVLRTLTISPTGSSVSLHILVPDVFPSSLKIADNDSPRPEDRVFFTYNTFQNVHIPIQNNGFFPISSTGATGTGQIGFSHVDVCREIVGFEKTFAGGDASVEVRLPIVQVNGDIPQLQGQSFSSSTSAPLTSISGGSGIGGTDLGDLDIILKYALYNDHCTGDVVTMGLLASLPTSDGVVDSNGRTIHDTFVEPFFGFVWNQERFYVQGFSSIAVGLESQNATFLFNDLGIGYWLYKDRCGCNAVKGIVPTFEVHVNTPLNDRQSLSPGVSSDSVIGLDTVDLTVGAHLVFRGGSTLTLGAAIPVTGPRPDNYELIAQLNLRF